MNRNPSERGKKNGGISEREVDSAVEDSFPASDPASLHVEGAGDEGGRPKAPPVPISREDRFVSWLKDAYAMEKTLGSMLGRQAEHAGGFAGLRPRLVEHAKAANRHAELIEGLLAGRGVERADLENWTGGLRPRLQALTTGSTERTMLNDTQAGIAAEHFVIACYHGLRAAAEVLGDQQAIEVCEEILRNESAMASFLERELSAVAREELG